MCDCLRWSGNHCPDFAVSIASVFIIRGANLSPFGEFRRFQNVLKKIEGGGGGGRHRRICKSSVSRHLQHLSPLLAMDPVGNGP